ncbi:MAG: helix-turn-helix domain-containing protein [Xanthomonadales bacterium]|nr:helix-turn-helix domain-containing protein [Xanthomonadales bacterium]
MGSKPYTRTCSIWRALEIVGDTPTLLILESLWLGARRFDEIQQRTGLLRTVVSNRLKKLVEHQCLDRVAYSRKPLRYEYRATERFRDLYEVALSLLHWERRWGTTEGKVDIRLRHKACGQETSPEPVCSGCRKLIDPRDTSWQLGPGEGLMVASYSRRRRSTRDQQQGPTTLFDDISRVIGDRWSALIIRSIFTGMNRYDELREDTRMATNVLSDRLTALVEAGFMIRQEYQQNPVRYAYKLTEKGRDIYPILLFLMEWGDRWLSNGEGPPLIMNHQPCGERLHAAMACSACGEFVQLGDLEMEVAEAVDPATGEVARAI